MARSKHEDQRYRPGDEVELKSKTGFAFLCYTFGAMLYMIGFPSEYFIIDDANHSRMGLWAVCNQTTNACQPIEGSTGTYACACCNVTSHWLMLCFLAFHWLITFGTKIHCQMYLLNYNNDYMQNLHFLLRLAGSYKSVLDIGCYSDYIVHGSDGHVHWHPYHESSHQHSSLVWGDTVHW
jgi:hypothetical protein